MTTSIDDKDDDNKLFQYILDGNIDDASKEIQRRILINPKNPDYYFFRLMYLNDHATASDDFEALSDILSPADFYLIRCIYNFKNMCKSDIVESPLDDVENYIALAKTDDKFFGYMVRGRYYLIEEQYEEALNNLNISIQLNSNNWLAYQECGYCYYRMENYYEAIVHFDKAIEANESHFISYIFRSACYCKLKEYDKFVHDLEKYRQYLKNAGKVVSAQLTMQMTDDELTENMNYQASKINNSQRIHPQRLLENIYLDYSSSHDLPIHDVHKLYGIQGIEGDMLREFNDTSFPVYYMLKAMEILFEFNSMKFYCPDYLLIAKEIDKLSDNPIGIQISEKNLYKHLLWDILQYYPKLDDGLLQRDGKDLFLIRFKLCLLEHIFDEINFETKGNFYQNLLDMIPQYFAINKILQEKNIELIQKKEQEKSELKTNIFQAVSHTLSNIMLANRSIIKKIKNSKSTHNDIERLELMNNIVITTMKAIKIAFRKDSVDPIQSENELFFEKIQKGISLYHLLYFCLNINLHYLVTGEEGWETVRKIFFDLDDDELIRVCGTIRKAPGFSINELTEKNVEEFIDTFHSDLLRSIHQFFSVDIESLRHIYVKEDSYTFAILFIILLELTKNMLRYGSIENETVRKYSIKSASEDQYQKIILSNITGKSKLTLKESTLQGLAMIQEFAKALGRFEKIEKQIEDTDWLEFITILYIKTPTVRKGE